MEWVEVEAKFAANGLQFPRHAVAVTGVGSDLDKDAGANGWLARFPMPDWIGGRTSVMSAVGLLPMALQGFDIDAFLAGAAAMGRAHPSTRRRAKCRHAFRTHVVSRRQRKGEEDMVVLPYKLVMESLGKEKNLGGEIMHQGIAVYGNKGSTDQHSYVQQLRDGVLNFFVTFVEVRNDRRGARFEVEDGIASGDYLEGFLRETCSALHEKGRESITMSIP
jgi:glucose-6-phosphate isomerase